MNLCVIVDCECRAFVRSEDVLHTLLILIPAVVLERRDVEENVWTLGIKLSDIGWIERGSTIPDFLHQSFVRRAIS